MDSDSEDYDDYDPNVEQEENDEDKDADSSDDWDDQEMSRNHEMDLLMSQPPEAIVLKARDQAKAEVKATMNSAESLKDIALLIRGRESELAAKKKERSQVLRSQVSSARTAIALLEASQNTINDIRNKFDDVKEHSDKKRIARKDQILELSFKHEMVNRIVSAVDMIKSIQKSDGILKELRGAISNEKVFEKDIASIHAKVESMEHLRDSLGKMALDPSQHFAPSDMADGFAQRTIGTPLAGVVSSFEETMWAYMEDCLLYAMEKPWMLVKINRIIVFEEERDLDRAEQGAPFVQKRWEQMCDVKINKFIEKRFEEFQETDPKDKLTDEYKLAKSKDPPEKSPGELKIIAAHLAGHGVTIEELHRRVDDLSNIKEYMIPCFPNESSTGDSRAEVVWMSILAQFHTRIFKFLQYICEQRDMLILAPRAIVAYIDFVENYYWRLEDQLFLDPEMKQLSPHLRHEISVPLRSFYLEGMRRKFKEFVNEMINGDYDSASKAVKDPPEDGVLLSATTQDVFNMMYQNIDTIEQMNDPEFLCEGYKKLGDCLYDFTTTIKKKLAVMENAGTKNDHFLFGCTVINNTPFFLKQTDIFMAKAMASCGEYADLLSDGEQDKIIGCLINVQSDAFDSLANAVLHRAVHRHIPHLFVHGKWYDTRQFSKKSATAKPPVVISITDELHEHFQKVSNCLAKWEMMQFLTVVLQRLIAHYITQVFKTDAIKLEEQTSMGTWKYTDLMMEDRHTICELFKHWVFKTDPMEDPVQLVEREHMDVFNNLLSFINTPQSDSDELKASVRTLAKKFPDFNQNHMHHILDKRNLRQMADNLTTMAYIPGNAESETASVAFMPFTPVVMKEVEAEGAVDEAALTEAELEEASKEEERCKIQAAFDEAAFDLENRADKDMDFDDFMS